MLPAPIRTSSSRGAIETFFSRGNSSGANSGSGTGGGNAGTQPALPKQKISAHFDRPFTADQHVIRSVNARTVIYDDFDYYCPVVVVVVSRLQRFVL